MAKKTAWLIGAGFSFELGMPLVVELTGELKRWLTPQHLRELAASWSAQGDPVPGAIIDAFADRLTRSDENYEQLIGWLQSEQFRYGPDSRHYQFLAGKLQGAVGVILFQRHARNPAYHRQSLPWYRGLIKAVPDVAPLWMFSLNHDLCVEMLAIELGLVLSCGFAETNALGFTGPGGERVHFDRIARSRLAAGDLAFLESRGINLVKLHGSLDVYACNDCKDFLRVRPQTDTVQGWIEAIEMVEQKLAAQYMGRPFPVEGEICVQDDAGESQFLRRTPVAGAFKFDRHAIYNAPGELVEFFARKLYDFDELVVIGYSWGDRHLNEPIEKWLEADSSRSIVNVDPYGLPARADHIRPRVDDRKVTCADFLAKLHGTPIGRDLEQHRALRLLGRRFPDPQARFQDALRAVMSKRISDVVAWAGQQNLTAPKSREEVERLIADEVGFDQSMILDEIIREIGGEAGCS